MRSLPISATVPEPCMPPASHRQAVLVPQLDWDGPGPDLLPVPPQSAENAAASCRRFTRKTAVIDLCQVEFEDGLNTVAAWSPLGK